jgi:hypothetical protein
MNYYEVLGVSPDASAEEVRHGYLAKVEKMRPEQFTGASEEVLAAATQAGSVIERAWHVLADPLRRAQHDRELGEKSDPVPNTKLVHAEHVWAMERELGLSPSAVFGFEPPPDDRSVDVSGGATERSDRDDVGKGDDATSKVGLADDVSSPSRRWGVSPVHDPLAGLEAVADWLAPHPRLSRMVTVPEVRTLRASEAFYLVAKADLRINFVRLTENPAGADGIVVDQDPLPGASVPRHSELIIQVVHPVATEDVNP